MRGVDGVDGLGMPVTEDAGIDEPASGARPAAPRRDRAWRFAGLAFCLFMLVVHVAAGLNSPGVADFWRDLYWATSIAHGERFPLAGPPIYGLLELGPWWFYLLALPVALGGNAAAVSAFVQALAATKYLLAWRLGLRLRDARLGFAFALALAVPGWSMLPLMFPTHTAVVEAALLLLALATRAAWSHLSWRTALAFGLAAAACVHAHPTTIAFVGIAGLALLWRHRDRRAIAAMALAALVVLLGVLPPLLAPAVEAPAALKPIAGYLGADVMVDPLHRVPALLRSLSGGGAWWGYLLMTSWSEPDARRAWIASCVLGVFAVIGLLRLRRFDRPALRIAGIAAVLCVVQVTFLVCVRPITPMWMVPSCLPPLAVVYGLGWYGWLRTTATRARMVVLVALAFATALALAPFAIELRELRRVRVMPGINPFLDVIQTNDRYVMADVPWYPLHRLDRVSATLCEPAVLHGRLGALMEAAFSSPARNACGLWPSFRFGGVDGPRHHVLGMLPQQADSLGIAPDRVVAGMAFYERVRAIAPGQGGRSAPLRRRQIDPTGGSAVAGPASWAFDAGAADAVVLTNRMPNAAPMRVVHVSANGAAATVAGGDGSSTTYRCGACAAGTRVAWRVDVEAVAENLDLVVVDGSPRDASTNGSGRSGAAAVEDNPAPVPSTGETRQ